MKDAKGWLTGHGLLVNKALTAPARNGGNLAKRFQATLPAMYLANLEAGSAIGLKSVTISKALGRSRISHPRQGCIHLAVCRANKRDSTFRKRAAATAHWLGP